EHAQVLNHIVRAGITQHSHAGGLGGSQQSILGNSVATLSQDDVTLLDGAIGDVALVKALGGNNVKAEST
ncbi:hypothetical protein NQ344_27080, partial [Escherichia coli]|nr:hypothetical protein [Escherichia coli]